MVRHFQVGEVVILRVSESFPDLDGIMAEVIVGYGFRAWHTVNGVESFPGYGVQLPSGKRFAVEASRLANAALIKGEQKIFDLLFVAQALDGERL